jgi:hypothetical protein
MLLEELPEKTFHRLLKSVTWTEVERTLPGLRRFIRRVAQSSRWIMGFLGKRHVPTRERMI